MQATRIRRQASSARDPAVKATLRGNRFGGASRYPEAVPLTATFRSLHVRNFRLFIVGLVVSATGSWMQGVAAPWLVLQLTGSGVALGIDTALQFLPILLIGAWGGVIADRFDNRRVLVWTQIAFAIPALALFVLDATHVVQVWMVYALSFLSGIATAIDMPTRQSFYLEMVGPDDLTNAMSLTTATFTGMRMVGPVLAGILIPFVGTAPIFLINALSYLAVVFALVAMRRSELHPRPRTPRAPGQIREGIRYVWEMADLRLPMLTMASVFLFAFNFSVLIPLFATRDLHGGAGAFGVLLGVFGIGSLAGSLFMAARATRPNPRRLCILAVALGVVTFALAFAPNLAVAAVVIAPLGFTGIAFAITGNSTLQLTSAPDRRGRVMALYTIIFLGSTPIGAPLAGWVGQHSPSLAFAAGGVIAAATGLAALAALTRATRPPARPPADPFVAAPVVEEVTE
jgi:MFS family permease